MMDGAHKALGLRYTRNHSIPWRGNEVILNKKTQIRSENTSEFSKKPFLVRGEVTFLVASFFCCTFAPEMKNTQLIQLLIAALLSLAGIALLFLGTILAPQGEIHETVLIAFGEIATFAGSIIGIDYHYKSKKHDNQTDSEHKEG